MIQPSVIPLISEKADELFDLCRQFKVGRLELFGSATDATSWDATASDLDFLVEYLPLEDSDPFDCYFDFLLALEELYGRRIDLVMTKAIRNKYFLRKVNESRTDVYTAPGYDLPNETRLSLTETSEFRAPIDRQCCEASMPLETLKFLEDIRVAASRIQEFTSGISFQDYETSVLIQQATERNFEIIGEALSRLKRTDADVFSRVSEPERIIAFRNIIVHGYDQINNENVWKIIRGKLPLLLEQVEQLIEANGE